MSEHAYHAETHSNVNVCGLCEPGVQKHSRQTSLELPMAQALIDAEADRCNMASAGNAGISSGDPALPPLSAAPCCNVP